MEFVVLIFNSFKVLIFIRIILSWLGPEMQFSGFGEFVHDMTEPILSPLRVVIPAGDFGGIDFSPIFAFIILNFLERLII